MSKQLWITDLTAWKDYTPLANNLSWSQDADNLAMQVTWDSITENFKGNLVSLTDNKEEFFRGIIVKKATKKNTYSYTAMDYMWYLNKSKEVIQFNSIPASQAIEQLLAKEEIKTNIPWIGTNINQVFKDKPISDIIKEILEQVYNETGINYHFYMVNEVFTIAQTSTARIGAKLLINSDMTLDSDMEELKNSVVVVSNESENANIIANVWDSDSINRIGRLQEVVNVDDKNYSQAQQIAENTLRKLNKDKNTLNISCIALEGGQNIKPNNYLYFYFYDKFGGEGWYWIKSVSHTLANNQHKISLSLEW
ncbi:XkdQ/YqbQ family protein [Clostridium frigidicarnis]|uniref:YqbQ/XkdQ domain-containing protein n=1 Tax=Clostridium frigidicarnis TaxID=84698 RepID=A0A1I0V189_9CLOT|nr:hypothetical protein [Clostridium frigidicarnis]SFA70068.1 hypothetical protein SAMN04488528_100184 [Clostridium frigidicarnis]